MTNRGSRTAQSCVAAAATLIAVVGIMGGACPAAHAAEDAPADLVHARLVADVAAVQPGGRFTLGIILKIKPKWHTYWINPGDFGNPATVRWRAPEGFTFGPIQWPVPTKLNDDGFIAYVYEDEVMLLVPADASAALKAGDTVMLKASVKWLCCHDECIEGGADLTLTLSVADRATPANTELFDAWRRRLPAERTDAMKSVTQPEAKDGEPEPVLALHWRTPPKDVDWFPVATEAVGVQNVKVQHDGDRTTIRFATKIYMPDKVPPDGRVDGVLVFTDAQGHRTGVSLPARVTSARR
jgi:DsbC/DsbD-like thiol-disulfide interchange protein